jgi:hypothetical protein
MYAINFVACFILGFGAVVLVRRAAKKIGHLEEIAERASGEKGIE